MSAAGVGIPGCLYEQLLAVKDSLGGLDDQTVRRLVDTACESLEAEMRVAGITDQGVTPALGRHAGEIGSLSTTVATVLAEKAIPEAAHGNNGMTTVQKARKRKEENKRRKRKASASNGTAASTAAGTMDETAAASSTRGEEMQTAAAGSTHEDEMQ